VPEAEWDALVGEVRDLQARVAAMEAAMGMSAPAVPAAQAPIRAATVRERSSKSQVPRP
jgi:outer membrane murein-binding lipoprotein Lpp